MAIYSTVTFNSINLDVTSSTPTKKQKTRKVILGKSLSQVRIIGLNAQQWVITIRGIIFTSDSGTLSAKRAQIEGLDDAAVHAYVDGIHDGNYILEPGSLTFTDTGDRVNSSYVYTFRLIEE